MKLLKMETLNIKKLHCSRRNAVRWLILASTFLAIMNVTGRADSVINIHLDYKIIRSQIDGTRPSGIAIADILLAVEDMNALAETYFRGYRFVVDRVIDIGGIDAEVSQWYDIDFFNAPKDSAKANLEKAAEAKSTTYQWVNNAINLYITNGFCGGISSFPPNEEIIIIGGCSADNGSIQLHELGHYFDLCHTQGCPCGGCDTEWSSPCDCGGSSCVPKNETGHCHTSPGNDRINDTLEDLPCWDIDDIADHNYGSPYASLNAAAQARVDVAATNNMSYHHSKPLCNPIVSLTEGQLDWMADALDVHVNRRSVRDGSSFFVAKTGTLVENGYSYYPFTSVGSALGAVNPGGGDVLLLRPGAYNETITINKPVTLRATRAGPVVIGSASALRRETTDVHLTTRSTLELVEHLKAKNPDKFDATGFTCGTVRTE